MAWPRPRPTNSYTHTAVDDHLRLAYSEIHTDEKKETATAFWTGAHAFFTSCGITVERVLTDNGACYKSHTLARRPHSGRDRRQANPPLPATDQLRGSGRAG